MKVLREDEKQVPSTIFMEWSQLAFVRYLIIGGEAGLAAWLFAGIESDVASIVAMATLSAFTSLIIVEFKVEHPKPCGCTGTYVVAADPRAIRASLCVDLARNVVMMCGTVWLYISERVLTSPIAKSLNTSCRLGPSG